MKYLKLICIISATFIIIMCSKPLWEIKPNHEPVRRIIFVSETISDTVYNELTKVDTLIRNFRDTLIVNKVDTVYYSGSKTFINQFDKKIDEKKAIVSFNLNVESIISTYLDKDKNVFIQRNFQYDIENLKVSIEPEKAKLFKFGLGSSIMTNGVTIDLVLNVDITIKEKHRISIFKGFNSTGLGYTFSF